MNRRNMIRAAPSLMLLALVRPEYVPCGHLTADHPSAHRVKEVTLNGIVVNNVSEFNDVEGWLIYLDTEQDLRPCRLTGTVRAVWADT